MATDFQRDREMEMDGTSIHQLSLRNCIREGKVAYICGVEIATMLGFLLA